MCKQLKFGKNLGITPQQVTGATASPSSGLDWSSILSPEELKDIPDRSDPSYLGLCEKTISELKQQLEQKNDLEKVRAAEDQISILMAQLQVNPRQVNLPGAHSQGPQP